MKLEERGRKESLDCLGNWVNLSANIFRRIDGSTHGIFRPRFSTCGGTLPDRYVEVWTWQLEQMLSSGDGDPPGGNGQMGLAPFIGGGLNGIALEYEMG